MPLGTAESGGGRFVHHLLKPNGRPGEAAWNLRTRIGDSEGYLLAAGEELADLEEHAKAAPFTVVWDGSNLHSRSRLVKAYLAKHPEIVAETLPSYAPEANWTKEFLADKFAGLCQRRFTLALVLASPFDGFSSGMVSPPKKNQSN